MTPRPLTYYIVYYLTKLISAFFFPREIVGLDNVPPRGGCIFACNHQSYLDPVIMGVTTPRRLLFLARDSLFENKFLGFVLPRLDAIPIRRDFADFRALRATLRRLKEGGLVLIFPEGTRRKSNQPNNPEPGIGLLAAKSGVPIVPVYVSGSDKALPPGQKFLRRHPVTVYFGKPLTYSPGQDYLSFARQVMDGIEALAEKT